MHSSLITVVRSVGVILALLAYFVSFIIATCDNNSTVSKILIAFHCVAFIYGLSALIYYLLNQ